jgi:hypothetical protein
VVLKDDGYYRIVTVSAQGVVLAEYAFRIDRELSYTLTADSTAYSSAADTLIRSSDDVVFLNTDLREALLLNSTIPADGGALQSGQRARRAGPVGHHRHARGRGDQQRADDPARAVRGRDSVRRTDAVRAAAAHDHLSYESWT